MRHMNLKAIERAGALLVLLLSLCCVRSLAQTPDWVPAGPIPATPQSLAVFNCNSSSGVNARWAFASGGYRVTQPPVISRSGQTISVDARVEATTGVHTLAIGFLGKHF